MNSLVQPTFLLSALSAFALLRWLRRRKDGRGGRLVALSLLALILFASPPVAYVLSGSLEWWYRPGAPALAEGAVNGTSKEGPGAIVVLSGYVRPPTPQRPVPLLAQNTYFRTRYAAWIHKSLKALPIVVSGGPGERDGKGAPLSESMQEYLVQEGVPAEQIWVEARSRDTHENARYSAELLREKGVGRIILVTEAYHMLRSERCFRKEGIEVIPAPCEFYTADFDPGLADLIPSAKALQVNENVVHEWVGLVWYWVRGKI